MLQSSVTVQDVFPAHPGGRVGGGWPDSAAAQAERARTAPAAAEPAVPGARAHRGELTTERPPVRELLLEPEELGLGVKGQGRTPDCGIHAEGEGV